MSSSKTANGGRARLAADIGGTFTDIVLERDGRQASLKLLTTPRAPEEAVIRGILALLARENLDPLDVGVLIHGTTLATNALIERKGARTAFLTTEGLGDILETGFEKRYAHYDLYQERPPVLVPADRRFEVPERVAADGAVLKPLDEAAVHRIADRLQALEVEAVAVGLIHGYAFPAHEQRVRAILEQRLDGPTICVAAEVCPEIREYERFSTTVANAYVRPLMAGYLGRLEAGLAAAGIAAPVYLMLSGGGLTTLDQARRTPIRLVESGPAGGAILAGHLAAEMGEGEVMAFDMGGTTAKLCLLKDGEPGRARRFEVARAHRDLKGSGLPLRVPVIDLVEIGAGGGSLGRVDAMGRITVGPDSAGADPGPVCYGRGGTEPTVTDANLCLGRVDLEGFQGACIGLDLEAARAALERAVGRPLGLDAPWAAAGMVEIVDENMANAARVHAIERGRAIGRQAMIAFGGAAPLHAAHLARKLGITRVIVPAGAGVGSAIGFLRAPLAYEVVRSARMRLDAFDHAAANALLAEMAADARAVVAPALAGAAAEDLRASAKVDLCYAGQGHELTVALPAETLAPGDEAALTLRFETTYQASYGLRLDHVPIEITAWSLTVTAPAAAAEPLTPEPPEGAGALPPPEVSGERWAYDPASGEHLVFAVVRRDRCPPGTGLAGPALIVEDQTTTVLPPGWRARIAANLAIVLEDLDALEAGT
jgi:N-methylhydantoinase A